MVHLSDIHTSGHGGQEEQKLMLRLNEAKISSCQFMVNIECKGCTCKLAVDCGVPEENCFIMDNGDVLSFKYR